MVDDPLEPFRRRALDGLDKAETSIFAKVWELIKAWARRARYALFGADRPTGGMPDPIDLFQAASTWTDGLEEVIVEVVDTYTEAAHEFLDDGWEPDALAHVNDFAASVRNRLVGVPDRVFADVRTATMKATTEGWSIDELAGKIDEILTTDGAERWKNRALTIARTEALAAYNGGKFAGMVSVANQVGGQWEKIWLATHDHRTRWSHTKRGGGDLQRVALMAPFQLDGGSVMYPGDPLGPPGEIINCRCTILLVEQGESVDLSDRHYRSAR